MRFRSFGVSASNMEEYISKLKVQEDEYMEETTLSQLNFISLEQRLNQEDNNNDDYALLGHKSTYRIQKRIFRNKKRKRKRGRILCEQYFRKKIHFFHRKRKRINSEQIKTNTDQNGNI